MNVIFGERSNLSTSLNLILDDVMLLSGRNANQLLKYQQAGEKINVIINSFQRNTALNDFSNSRQYVERTLGDLSNIIDVLIEMRDSIGVVIYTSSASVYGENSCCYEEDLVHPDSLYSTLKISSEIMVKNYLTNYNINYIVARVFNMYGGNDSFSIISKIINSYLNDKKLHLVNDGKSVRDFIHISDVCQIYKKLLKSSYCGVINVATGRGYSVKSIIETLHNQSINFAINNVVRNEINGSVASISKLEAVTGHYDFIDVNDYILEKFSLDNNK
jgi:UDP-glucose 4-epimerase